MLLYNGKIFDGKKFLKENAIFIKNRIINDIKKIDGYKFKKYKGEKINLYGKIISPGFIDIHTHGAGGLNVLDIKNSDDLKKIRISLLKNGITSIVLTTLYSKKNKKIYEIINSNLKNLEGSRILGIYLESPFINTEKRGMILKKFIKTKNNYKSIVSEILNNCPCLKMITIAPEIKNSKEIIREFIKRKIIVSFGHSHANYIETKNMLNLGVKNVTHFLNAMTGIHHRNVGPFIAIWEKKDVFIEIIGDGNHIDFKMINFLYHTFGKNRIILISDSAGFDFKKEKSFYTKIYGEVFVKNGGLYSKDKILIGSILSLTDIVKRVKKNLNLQIEDVLQMVTYNPSRLLGERIGQIKRGYLADMVILNKKLEIYYVVLNGKFIKVNNRKIR